MRSISSIVPGALALVLLVGLWAMPADAQQCYQWELKATTGPGPRAESALAYDANSGTVVLFGGWGMDNVIYADTWTWDGVTWTNVSPTTSPQPRYGHTLAATSDGRVVLFGGKYVEGPPLGDTWVWDSSTQQWSSDGVDGPSARMNHAMTYNATGNVVMMGGATSRSLCDDTWMWNSGYWSFWCHGEPPARAAHAMAVNSMAEEVVLFGGMDVEESILSDTWRWMAGEWVADYRTPPPGRFGHAMATLPDGNVILHGGFGNDYVLLEDTWVWGPLGGWMPGPGFPTSLWRAEHAMCLDPVRGVVIMFGGLADGWTPQNDTWELALATGPQITLDPVGQTVPFGGQAGFHVEATGTGPLEYQWFKNDQVLEEDWPRIVGTTTDTLTIEPVQIEDAGYYYVEVADCCGSTTTTPVPLEVTFEDCNSNGVPDSADLASCQGEAWCDDCNSNGILDVCDIEDCNGENWCADCNTNGIPDACDISSEFSADSNSNGIPDECEPGACCHPGGSCTLTPVAACQGEWLGLGTTCDPNPCLQPGDTCEMAYVVGTLPYYDFGQTCSFNDDYDEDCDSDPTPGSPDVVYAYTPEQNITVDITLCRSSSFNTKLYVYENNCDFYLGGAYACNLDACSTINHPTPEVSSLPALELTAGQTYYVVVDGESESCGEYSLDMNETLAAPSCSPDTVFGLPPHRPNWAWTGVFSESNIDGSSVLAYERFGPVAVPICRLEWWGFMAHYDDMDSSVEIIDCTDSEPAFTIAFHPDDSGLPGDAVCQYTVVPSIEAVPLDYNGLTLQHFTVMLPSCCALSDGWLSLQGAGDASCWFFWLNAEEGFGDGLALVNYAGYGPEPVSFDFNFCLATAGGACCLPDGTCLPDKLESECNEVGGQWQGPLTSCEPNPCPVPITDCNSNLVDDAEDIASGTSQDCNHNAVPDECDLAAGSSEDLDANGVPDECDPDSDGDGVIDGLDGCPLDAGKIAPGACGCGTPDADGDGDGVPNCHDNCPTLFNPDQADLDADGVGDLCDDDQAGRPQPGPGELPQFMKDLVDLIAGAEPVLTPEEYEETLERLSDVGRQIPWDDTTAGDDGADSEDEREQEEGLSSLDREDLLALQAAFCPATAALMICATLLGLHRTRQRR